MKGFAAALLASTMLCTTAAYADEEQPTSASAADPGGLGEIVVTARRRAENIQSVPVAVTAVSEETLKAKLIADPYDLARNTPGLTGMSGSAQRNNVNYFIRGQGATFQSQPSVISYFADVPQVGNDTSGGTNVTYYDLDSIQVLKGPQGTLFGRTTTGGAVLINPKKPSGEFDGYGEIGIGNLGARNFTGAVNIPLIGDKLAVRIAGNYRYRDGFTTSLITGQDNDNVNRSSYRISVQAKPTDWLTNNTIFQDINLNENPTGNVLWRFEPRGSLLDTTPGGPTDATTGLGYLYSVYLLCGGDATCAAPRLAILDKIRNAAATDFARLNAGGDDAKRYYINSGFTDALKFHSQLFTNTTEINLGGLGFLGDTSIKNIFSTARNLHASNLTECCAPGLVVSLYGMDWRNGGPVDNNSYREKWMDRWSDEVQLAGKIRGRHDWIVGYYVETENVDQNANRGNPTYVLFGALDFPVGAAQVQFSPSRDYLRRQTGVFGQTTIDFGDFGLDNVHFTAGYRHSTVKQSVTIIPAIMDPVLGLIPSGAPDVTPPSLNQKADSYTFALDWKITPKVLVYATTRHGFKAGGINLSQIPFAGNPLVPQSLLFFEPETVTDYEVGAKTDWTLGSIRGRTNIALYLADFSNLQRSTTYSNPVRGGGPSSQIANIAATRTKGIELENTVRWTSQFETAISYAYTDAKYVRYPGTGVRPADGVVFNLIDSRISATPKHKFSLLASYDFVVPERIGSIRISANFAYQSRINLSDSAAYDPLPEDQAPYAVADLKLDWNNVMGNPVDLSFFVKNVTDKLYAVGSAHVMDSRLGTTSIQYSEPRTFGMQARFRFGASANR